ncbi:response regulator transcription factor [Leifsonia sp. ZF2019]|uniref:response regulator n=1 Tax=Leifsonia sp. ZF2019 TaxID=2781978 RepID=UPI001CBAB177|nr:response regulator transcription factor [Leifsonia sp. ZF2019]UAJ77820.1 response regulator transcription factor [Leifsonia sp. ZF2019]
MTPDPIRVFLADDHEIVRRGVAALVDGQDDMEVVGEAATAAQAQARIIAVLPDVAVLDVRLPDGSGIDVCRAVKQAQPGIRCLMLTAYDDEDAIRSAVIAGADGYVVKDIRAGKLLDDIRAASRGRTLIDPRVADRVTARLREPADDPRFASLGLRERQVLALIADGLTNRQIAQRLGLAEKTVKNYVSSLLSKLGLERRTQAAVLHLSQHDRT